MRSYDTLVDKAAVEVNKASSSLFYSSEYIFLLAAFKGIYLFLLSVVCLFQCLLLLPMMLLAL